MFYLAKQFLVGILVEKNVEESVGFEYVIDYLLHVVPDTVAIS